MNSHKGLAVQVSIALGFVGVLVIGIILFGLNIKSSTKKIAAARGELAVRTISLRSLASLRADYANKAQSYLNVLYNVIPQKDELIDLSKDIQAIASADNLEYGFTFVGETQPTEADLGFVKFNLKLGGDLTGLLNFLKNIDYFRYLIDVGSVSINREGSLMRMNLAGSVYFRR